jgi:hypothetical protein
MAQHHQISKIDGLYSIMTEFDDRYLNVDAHGVLRVPMQVWLGMVFLSRHWVLLVITLASVRRSPEVVLMASGGLSWVLLLLEVPALLLLFAGLSRHPTASTLWRKLWAKGIWITGLTAVINACMLGWWLWNADFWHRWPELFMASCVLLDFAIFGGFRKSTYIQQIFNEFPSIQGKQESKP